jgi:hypothetical protein
LPQPFDLPVYFYFFPENFTTPRLSRDALKIAWMPSTERAGKSARWSNDTCATGFLKRNLLTLRMSARILKGWGMIIALGFAADPLPSFNCEVREYLFAKVITSHMPGCAMS